MTAAAETESGENISLPDEMLETAGYSTGTDRQKISLNEEWKFLGAPDGSTAGISAEATDFDDSGWEEVQIPHTWNADDGADGGNNYRTGTTWYRRQLILPENERDGKRVYLEFNGACLVTELYVNGQSAGTHMGGYTAFRFDVTDYLADGENVFAVKVNNNNANNTDLLPRGGDFTIFGGIYRDVSLIIVDDVHLDLDDYASSGVYLTPTVTSGGNGALAVKTRIVNDSEEDQTVTVTAVLKTPVEFNVGDYIEIDSLAFEPNDMVGDGQTVATASYTGVIAANSDYEWVDKTMTVSARNLRLWNGLEDPFRYVVDVTVSVGGQVVDRVSQHVGFRSFKVTEDGGFFLNGMSYPLHGVSRHQDGYDVDGDIYLANALTAAEHERDMSLIYEMGANYVRLAHYPHDPYFYELCDQYGLIVWAEIPMVGGITNSSGFKENAKTQLIEMIRQQYNRPSVCFWGLGNELSDAGSLIGELNTLAKREDPGRLTTYATERHGDGTWNTDLVGWNIYPNWYYEDTAKNMMAERRGSKSGGKPVGISEYGAGANITQHQDPPQFSIAQSRGEWHPEEFQSLWHEGFLESLDGMDYLWSTAVWNMFDFGSDSRSEGGQTGINDKGLVTIDRQTKKDAFYLYKANWNDREQFVHINSSRFTVRDEAVVPVKVYSNCDTVELMVNGQPFGSAVSNQGFGVFQWENVPLNVGENTIFATGTKGGQTYTETITWTRQLSGAVLLESSSEALSVDNNLYQLILMDDMIVSELKDSLSSSKNGTWTLLDETDGEITDDALKITLDMRVRAVSEDGSISQFYTFTVRHLAVNKETISSGGSPTDNPSSYAVDADSGTYWASGRRYDGFVNSWLQIDLGEAYFINNIAVQWNNSTSNIRKYQYKVEVSADGVNYTTVADHSGNQEEIEATSMLKLTDTFTDEQPKAQYIRISNMSMVSSTMDMYTGRIEISEIMVNGWNMTSDTYKIDHEARTIAMPRPANENALTWQEAAKNINMEGIYRTAAEHNTGAYFVKANDQWKIVDSDGNDIIYTVKFFDSSSGYEGEEKYQTLTADNCVAGNQPEILWDDMHIEAKGKTLKVEFDVEIENKGFENLYIELRPNGTGIEVSHLTVGPKQFDDNNRYHVSQEFTFDEIMTSLSVIAGDGDKTDYRGSITIKNLKIELTGG